MRNGQNERRAARAGGFSKGISSAVARPSSTQGSSVVVSYSASKATEQHQTTDRLMKLLGDPDADFIAGAQNGDLKAFEELVRRYTSLIYRVLVAILGNREDAQDAMQDAFLSAFKHIAAFQWRSKFSTWLVSIARNAALQQLRHRKDEEIPDGFELGEERDFRPRQIRAWQDNPEQLYSKVEIRHIVERGILELSAKYRAVVMLRDVEQLSTDDVARKLGISIPSVKTRLLRGRLMLREWLSPYFAKDGHERCRMTARERILLGIRRSKVAS
jgi:RNA polymerase sigma-70 factor, ECF subfamily